MAATVAGILLSGDHASRPAASAPPVGSVYSCSDHSLVYVTDGASWTTWADLTGTGGSVATDAIWDAAGDLAVGTGANTAARVAIGAAGSVLRSNGTTAAWAGSAWTNFTPTWTSDGSAPSLGNGTLTGRYKALDANTYLINIFFQMGSTSDNGTGNYSFALPGGVTSAAYPQSLAGIVLDAGTRYYINNGYIDASATKVTWIVNSESGGAGRTGETTPMTFVDGDQIVLSGVIEVA